VIAFALDVRMLPIMLTGDSDDYKLKPVIKEMLHYLRHTFFQSLKIRRLIGSHLHKKVTFQQTAYRRYRIEGARYFAFT